MSTAVTFDSAAALLRRLPAARGDLRPFVPLAAGSWLGVGGPAEVLFRPADPSDLADFLAARPEDVPVTIIGATSNLLVRDGGVPGVVVRLGPSFGGISIRDNRVVAGAGAFVSMIARRAMEASLGAMEFLGGIPGTLGGAIRMNAGAHGHELCEVLREVTALDSSGSTHVWTVEDLKPGYRCCGAPDDAIFISAVLEGLPAQTADIQARMEADRLHREAVQPVRIKTAGSTFRNPPDGPRAWELIDRAGCRGLHVGGAKMHEVHCNFMVNTGSATASDLETLGETVRKRVLETSGVELVWEVRRIGLPRVTKGETA